MKVPATVLRAIRAAASEHGVDLDMLAAIIYQESAFNPLAVGDLDAGLSLGLGQLNLRGAGANYRSGPGALLDPLENARAAARYLRACLDAYPSDLERGTSAYNQGIAGASKVAWRQVNGTSYVDPVMAILHQIREEGLEEDWDPDVPPGLREHGKTLLDVAINLRGICDHVLPIVRRAVQRAEATVADGKGL